MKLISTIRAAAACVAIAVLSGCAHNITISGDSTSLTTGAKPQQIDKVVGLVITDEQRMKDVTTPGGGGDKVTYNLLRDGKRTSVFLTLPRRSD